MRPMRFVAAALLVSAAVYAKEKKPKAAPKEPQDSIEVVGHIPLADGPVSRFLPTQHYSSYYLYAEHEGGKNLTLIDVTQVAHPVLLAETPYPADGGSASIFAVAGTAALVTDGTDGAAASPKGQTLRIMDFSDPKHPKVAREFTGVTAMSRDERRGLVFLANGEGIWILHETFAEDPKVQEEYAKHVMYDR